MIIEVSFGTFAVLGILWAIQIMIQIETISRLREVQKQLYTAVKKLAVELETIRDAHESHVAGKPEPPKVTRRRSTDVADWVVDSGIGNAGTQAVR